MNRFNRIVRFFLSLFLVMGVSQKAFADVDAASICGALDEEFLLAVQAGEAEITFEERKCLKIESVEVRRLNLDLLGDAQWGEIEESSKRSPRPDFSENRNYTPVSADKIADLTKIINIGKKIWKVIEANEPVVNVSEDLATAMPLGVEHWGQLENWQTPRVELYQVVFRNGFGIRVVDLTYRLHYTYGGGVEGMGQYLTHLTIVPSNLKVLPAFRVNLQASVPNVINVGSRKEPIAGAEFVTRWQVNSTIIHQQGSASFFVRGDGAFLTLDSLTNHVIEENQEGDR
jgi:hypothetical protein